MRILQKSVPGGFGRVQHVQIIDIPDTEPLPKGAMMVHPATSLMDWMDIKKSPYNTDAAIQAIMVPNSSSSSSSVISRMMAVRQASTHS